MNALLGLSFFGLFFYILYRVGARRPTRGMPQVRGSQRPLVKYLAMRAATVEVPRMADRPGALLVARAKPLRRLAVAAITFASVMVAAGATATSASAAVCADYSNQRDAQLAKDTRDADDDGIYCEALPCPCLKPGQSGTPESPPAKRRQPVKAPEPKTPKYVAPPELHGVTITSVVSGDTVRARTRAGGYLTVSLLGIEAPNPPSGADIDVPECGGAAAAEALESFRSQHPDVVLIPARSKNAYDRYDRNGRLRAYVVPVGKTPQPTYQSFMLSEGWAVIASRDRGQSRNRQFARAQSAGRTGALGLWAQCGGDVHRPRLPAQSNDLSAAAGDRTIVETSRGIYRIGNWNPASDRDSLKALISTWGPPDRYHDCEAHWDELGATAGTSGYATPGGCSKLARAGAVKNLELSGPGWRTGRGLAIGDLGDAVFDRYAQLLDESYDNEGVTMQPLTGYFLGGPVGPIRPDVLAEINDSDHVTSLFVTLIYGA